MVVKVFNFIDILLNGEFKSTKLSRSLIRFIPFHNTIWLIILLKANNYFSKIGFHLIILSLSQKD